MTKFKILSVLLSFVSLAGLGFVISSGIGTLHQGPLTKTQALLAAGASQMEANVNSAAEGLIDIVTELTANKDLATALSGLAKALKNAKPPEERPAPQQNRIDKAAEKLDEYREAFRAQQGEAISGVTFVDENGIVLKTDSAIAKEGEAIKIPPFKAPPLEGEDESVYLEGEGSLVQFALGGHALDGVTVAQGKIYYVAAAPVPHPVQKKKIIGVALVDRRLTALPAVPGLEALLMVNGEVALGNAPAGFAAPAEGTEGAFLAVPAADVPATPPGLMPLPYLGVLGPDHQPGTWAHGYAIPGAPDAAGFVTIDLVESYSTIHGLQVLVILMALAIWLLHLILIALDGRSIRKGVTQVADFLGQVTGGTTEARNLPERKVTRPVRRLTRLVNQALEHYVGGGHVPKLPASPTVDDVLGEAQVDEDSNEAPDFDGLQFEGIEGSGTLDTGTIPNETPDAEDIGEASDGFDDSIAELGDEVVESETQPDAEFPLPTEEAGEAIDHLDDDKPTPTPPPPPPDDIGEFDDDGPPDLSEKTTEMMEVTPDVLDQLKSDVETKRSTAPLPPGLDDELAELEAAADARVAGKAPMPPPPPPTDDNAETAVMQVTPELIAQMKAVADGEAAAAEKSGGAPTPPPPPASKPDPEAERQAHFKEVYEDFVKTRKECGEKGELSFDKFAKRLEQSRAAVMNKHKCSDVRFQVYVKNGKAALKATPAK